MINIIVIFIALIVLIITTLWQGSLLWATIIGSPIVYSWQGAVRDSLKLASTKKGDTVIDLGCGNGRTLIIAAKEFGAKGIGVDRSYFCYIRSNINIYLAGQTKNIKIIRGDFKKAEQYLKKANIVYLYLLTSTMAQIEDWFFDAINDKTRVVSLGFIFPKHKPVAEVETYTLRQETKARLYKK